MENQQPEALELASLFDKWVIAFGEHPSGSRARAAKELRRLHARNQELEAMLESVGAGGVSAQRVTQAADHIAQDRKMVAAQETFGYFKAELFGWRDCAETDEGAIALYEAPHLQADALDVERLVEIVRAIERAFQELPENFAINIKLANGVASGFLSGPGLTERRIANGDFVEDINAAIDAAIAAAKGAQK